jgi:hypothetical protein
METKQNVKTNKPSKTRPDLDPNLLIRCVNITRGKLFYKSARLQGYTVTWNEFGESADIELAELMAMKNKYPKFFSEPYILIDEPNVDEIFDYLRVKNRHFEDMIDVDDFDSIYKKPVNQFKKLLEEMPNGLKNSVKFRARELIQENKLDSLKIINVIEEVLKVDLSF